MLKRALPSPVSVTVRIDGSSVGVFETDRIGPDAAYLPTAELPLTVHSFIELELEDDGDRIIVPAYVTEVGDNELVAVFEHTDEAFNAWHRGQFDGGVAN